MRMRKLWLLLALLPLLVQADGFPSRPKFQSVVVGTAVVPPPTGLMHLDGTTNSSWIEFGTGAGGVRGYMGAANTTDGLCTGSVAGDLCLRAQSGNVRLSRDGGTTSTLIPVMRYGLVNGNLGSCSIDPGSQGFASCAHIATGVKRVTLSAAYTSTTSFYCVATGNTDTGHVTKYIVGNTSTTQVTIISKATSATATWGVPSNVDDLYNLICVGT